MPATRRGKGIRRGTRLGSYHNVTGSASPSPPPLAPPRGGGGRGGARGAEIKRSPSLAASVLHKSLVRLGSESDRQSDRPTFPPSFPKSLQLAARTQSDRRRPRRARNHDRTALVGRLDRDSELGFARAPAARCKICTRT